MPQNLRCSIQTFPAQSSLIGWRNGLSVLEGEAPLGPSLSTHTQSLQHFALSSNRQKIQHNSTWTSATQPALSVPAATEARPAAGAHGDTAEAQLQLVCWRTALPRHPGAPAARRVAHPSGCPTGCALLPLPNPQPHDPKVSSYCSPVTQKNSRQDGGKGSDAGVENPP